MSVISPPNPLTHSQRSHSHDIIYERKKTCVGIIEAKNQNEMHRIPCLNGKWYNGLKCRNDLGVHYDTLKSKQAMCRLSIRTVPVRYLTPFKDDSRFRQRTVLYGTAGFSTSTYIVELRNHNGHDCLKRGEVRQREKVNEVDR